MVAEQVSVTRYRYADILQTNSGSILQTSSELKGTMLPANKAEINNPGSPHSMRSCIAESIKASIY